MTIAEALRRFRKEKSLKQKDVAAALGVKPPSYAVYEANVTPSAKVIIKIADAFNVSTDYLLGRTDTPQVKSVTSEKFENVIDTEKFKIGLYLLNEALRVKPSSNPVPGQ